MFYSCMFTCLFVYFEVLGAIQLMKHDVRIFEESSCFNEVVSCQVCDRKVPVNTIFLCGPHGAVVRCLTCNLIVQDEYIYV